MESAQQRAERYLREERSVSGAKDNNPDKYDLVKLSGDQAADLAAINASADKGFRVEDQQPEIFSTLGYVLMNGYSEKK